MVLADGATLSSEYLKGRHGAPTFKRRGIKKIRELIIKGAKEILGENK